MSTTLETDTQLESCLDRGEHVLWQGQPGKNLRLPPTVGGCLAIGLYAFGTVLLMLVTLVTDFAEPVVAATMIFVLAGSVVLLFWRRDESRRLLARKFVLTDRRALVIASGKQPSHRAVDWLNVTAVKSRPRRDGGGQLLLSSTSSDVLTAAPIPPDARDMVIEVQQDLRAVRRLADEAIRQARRQTCEVLPTVASDAELQQLVASPIPRQVTPTLRQRLLRGLLDRQHLSAGLAALCLGTVAMALVFPWRLMDELRLDFGQPARVDGRITDVKDTGWTVQLGRPARGNPRPVKSVSRVRFTFVPVKGGEPVEGTCFVDGQPRNLGVVPGRPVPIEYRADYPYACRLVGSRLTKFGYQSILIALIPAWGLWRAVSLFRTRREAVQILRTGIASQAKINRVEPVWPRLRRWTGLPAAWRVHVSIPAEGVQLPASYLADQRQAVLAKAFLAGNRPLSVLYDYPIPEQVVPVDHLLDYSPND
ncbi:MAG: hypothetical protein U0795_19010 [Pirellulales bacterium]